MFLSSYLKYAIIFVILIIIQGSFVWLISISSYNITPDIVIIVVIYLGYSRGQIPGMISGFISGLILDILGGSFIGLSALCYCIAGFIAGYFYRGENEKSSKKVSLLGIIFVCTVVAYSIFFIIYFQGASISFVEIFFKYVLTTTVYTMVFGVILVLLTNRFDLKKTF